MTTSDWILVWSTLALGVAALFGPTWADQIKASLLRPALRLVFIQAQPDCHLTRARFQLSLAQVSMEPCYVFRLRIQNKGRSQAKRCEVLIEGIAVPDASGRYVPLATYTPVRLGWGSGATDAFVDINPDRDFYCDFFKIQAPQVQQLVSSAGGYITLPNAPSGVLGLELDVTTSFYSQPSWLPPGKYKFTLAVHSENATIARADLFVAWSGVWQAALDDMFRECVVSTRAAT